MLTFRPAIEADVARINAQVQQEIEASLMVGPAIAPIVGKTMAFTGLDAGRPIGIAGVLAKWPGTLSAWALFSPSCGPHMVQIVRFVKNVFDGLPQKRIEATVLHNFEPGHKLMKLLGFVVEAPLLRCYDPAGRDFTGYVRIRE